MSFFKRILVPIDFRRGADQALRHAIALASGSESELHLLHVVVGPLERHQEMLSFVEMVEWRERMEQKVLQEWYAMASSIQEPTFPVRYASRRHVEAAQGILDYVADHEIDLILMGTRGDLVEKPRATGSTATKVVRHGPCAVLTVSAAGLYLPGVIRRILVHVDFSEHAALALRQARQIAQRTQANLTVVHVIEPTLYLGDHSERLTLTTKRSVGEAYADLETFYKTTGGPSVPHRFRVVRGQPAQAITGMTRRHATHLIVQGTRAPTNIASFVYDRVAEEVVRTAPCPVMTVKGSAASPHYTRAAKRITNRRGAADHRGFPTRHS